MDREIPQKPIANTHSTYDSVHGDTVVKPVAILMLAQILDKGFYLVREMLVSARFGASALTDAFNVGLYVSNFIQALLRPLIEDTFIPVYIQRLAQGREEAQRLLETVVALILLVIGVVMIGVYAFTPQVVSFIAPGFPVETAALTVQIVRVMMIFTLVLALTNFLLSVLTAHKAFLLVGLSPLVATAIAVVAVWCFSGALSIQSLTWGMVVGTLMQLAILAVGLRRRRLLRLHIALRFKDVLGALGTFTLWMLLVRLIGMGVGWVDRSLSSRLAEGSIAALGFALNIYQFPFQICVLAVTTVAITQFSWRVAQDDLAGLKRDFSLAVRIAAFFMIPSTVALIVLRQPIVQALYERGAFEVRDTAMTASALLCYALGLFPQAIVFIAVRLFLARQEAHCIFSIVLVEAIVHGLLDLILIESMKQTGIALATSVGAAAMSTVSLWLVRRKIGPLGGRAILISFIKVGLAAMSMGVGLYIAVKLLSSLPLLILIGVCVTGGLAAYLSVGYLIRLDELKLLAGVLSRRLGTVPGIVSE